jgi:hypothetical protein
MIVELREREREVSMGKLNRCWWSVILDELLGKIAFIRKTITEVAKLLKLKLIQRIIKATEIVIYAPSDVNVCLYRERYFVYPAPGQWLQSFYNQFSK